MKLITRIIYQLSIVLSIVLAGWAALFYAAMVEEINDETDDMLDEYAEQIVIDFLAGREIATEHAQLNNQYFIRPLTLKEAQELPHISYTDSMIYIRQKHETEPARVLTMIFKTQEDLYYELTVATPTIEKRDLIMAILGWLIFLYACLLLTLLVANLWVYHRSMKPLRKLLLWLKDYRVGQPNTPLRNDTSIIEFRQLNAAAVSNMEQAEKLFEEQKLFIGNASHEMQTPVAVSLNRLEMLMEDESLSERQLDELAKVASTLEYLKRLNKALLLLVKIDNGQFPADTTVNINTLVRNFLNDYAEAYTSRKFHISIDEHEVLTLPMNEVTASVLVNNLLKNAFVHSPEGEENRIGIRLTASSLTVSNSGHEALDDTHIFTRFYQGRKREGSTGLGLALVKAACDNAGLHLTYYYKDGMHHFRVGK